MIDRNNELSISCQAKLLGISRGSVYYQAQGVNEADLDVMRHMDELHLQHPFMSARQLSRQLRRLGFEVGRLHVRTLMRRIGIEAQAPQPGSSKPAPGHKVYPYLLRNVQVLPALVLMMAEFPFEVRGFHSDNGSEFINHRVARLLDKLRIEQTKSRARHSNDNALAESKNASVVRKHFGYEHIPKQYATPINRFLQDIFNPWLNLRRPCMYASEKVSPKGKIVKQYEHKNVQTPLEKLTQLQAQGLVTLRPGKTLQELQAQARQKTGLQAAREMQQAKHELFALLRAKQKMARRA